YKVTGVQTCALPIYRLLNAIGERFPGEADGVCRDYAKKGGPHRRTTLCRVLREKWGAPFARELLTPLLRDRSEASRSWDSVNEDGPGPLLPLRVCDEAAVTLAKHEALSFKLVGTYRDLDRQIQVILKTLKK